MDAAVGAGNWSVAVVENEGSVVASMPFTIQKKMGLVVLGQPPLTQVLGPWLRDFHGKSAKKLSQQKAWMTELIQQLPQFDHYAQNWSWHTTNWLPFFWHGYRQTTCYTYVLEDIVDLEQVWRGFRENIRTDIKKAQKRFGLQVDADGALGEFLLLNGSTFRRQGLSLPYSVDLVRRLDAVVKAHSCRKIFVARDSEGRTHAAVYLVWDQQSAYYLMGGSDPELRHSGAVSLCLWEAIRFASTVTKHFDFEGSMIEPVERFFRSFGATQKPYFSVSKTPSRLLQLRHFLRDLKAGRS